MGYQRYIKTEPLRPILASTESFNHECAKWLSDIISPLRSHSINLKDTFPFTDEVKNLSLNDSVMYSFDVVSLFTNIPLQFTTQLVSDTIFKDNIETFHNLNKRRLKTLLSWAASSTISRKIPQASGWGPPLPRC